MHPAGTLGNVGRDGNGRTPKLIADRDAIFHREFADERVGRNCKVDRSLPDDEILVMPGLCHVVAPSGFDAILR